MEELLPEASPDILCSIEESPAVLHAECPNSAARIAQSFCSFLSSFNDIFQFGATTASELCAFIVPILSDIRRSDEEELQGLVAVKLK